jgi:hypothetical protein
MTRAIKIIQDDMRNFFRAGFALNQYTADHVISALLEEGLDPRAVPVTPANLLLEALADRCRKALDE